MGWWRRKRKEKNVAEQLEQPEQPEQPHHYHDITEDDLALVWQELRRLRESHNQSSTAFRDQFQAEGREEEGKVGDMYSKFYARGRSQGRPSENANTCQANPCFSWEPWEGYRQHHVKINDPSRAETGELLEEFLQDNVAMIAPMNPVGCHTRTSELVEEFVQNHVAPMVPRGCEPGRGAWDSSITDKLPSCSSPYEIADDAVKLFRTRISDDYCSMTRELSESDARQVPTKKATFYEADVPAGKYMKELSKANRTLLPPTETKKEQNKNQDPSDLMHMLVLMKKVYTFLAVGEHDMGQLLSISALLQRVDSKLSGWKTTNVVQPRKAKLVGADPTSLRDKVSSLIDQIAEVSDSYLFLNDPRKENFDDDDITLFDDDTFDYSLDSTLADSLTATLSLDESLTLSREKDDESLTIPSIRSFIRLDDSDSDTLTNDDTCIKRRSDDSDSVTDDDTIRKEFSSNTSPANKYQKDTFEDEASVSMDSIRGSYREGDGYNSIVEKKKRDGTLEYHRNRVSLACCIVGGKKPSHHEDLVVKVYESERSHTPTVATTGSTAKSSSMASKKPGSSRSRTSSTLSSTVRAARTNSYDSFIKKTEFIKKLREISREHGGYTGRSDRHHPSSRSSKGSLGRPLPFTILRIVERDNSTLSDFSFRDEKASNSGGGSSRHWSDTKSTSNSTSHSTANSSGHWSGNLTITETRGSNGRRVTRQFDTEVL